ncbi:hypothetical protein ABV409_14405 [Flagellimonas sp. DF-77]|uniref:hypothetical protein n=1 Tax=Flagellimonas algarum TaxID=3230298 RepID=UPI003395E7C3
MLKPVPIAYFLGILGIITALKLQYDLALDYAELTGKERALFGLRHLDLLPWAGLGVLTILLAGLGRLGGAPWKALWIPILLGVVQILLVFLELWRLG